MQICKAEITCRCQLELGLCRVLFYLFATQYLVYKASVRKNTSFDICMIKEKQIFYKFMANVHMQYFIKLYSLKSQMVIPETIDAWIQEVQTVDAFEQSHLFSSHHKQRIFNVLQLIEFSVYQISPGFCFPRISRLLLKPFKTILRGEYIYIYLLKDIQNAQHNIFEQFNHQNNFIV